MPGSLAVTPRWRQRIDRLVRRAEREPQRVYERLGEELGPFLRELGHGRERDPWGLLADLLHLLERLSETCAELVDRADRLEAAIADAVRRLRATLRAARQAEEPGGPDEELLQRLLQLWADDASGLLQEIEDALLEEAESPGAADCLVRLLRGVQGSVPLVFPAREGGELDLNRQLLLAERHRLDRLLGEVLARRGQHEMAILVARDHYRRTHDAVDLVEALERAGHQHEALGVARHALSDPRAFRRARLQQLLEGLLAEPTEASDRETRRRLEEDFLSNPTRTAFRAIKAIVPAEQWVRVRGRLLGHLEKHQKAPTVLFELLLDEGLEAEADALATRRPVHPDTLVAGAQRVAIQEPQKAAGWLVLAAFSRAASEEAAVGRIVRDLRSARDLAALHGQQTSFEQALRRFRRRFFGRTALETALDRAGLRVSLLV